jgi:hypothetical protein
MMVSHQSSDAPLLPVHDLEKLHQFRPDLVDFVVTQTALEAESRRVRAKKLNTFIFIERIFGSICALSIGIAGIGGGVYAGLNGQPWLGSVITTTTVGTLAVAFIYGKK